MNAETVQALLDHYVETIYTQVSSYFMLYVGGLVLFWAALLFLRRRRSNRSTRRRVRIPDISVGPGDAALGIMPLNVAASPRPDDGSYFQTVLAFAQTKVTEGKPLMPQEHFALGELAFLERLLVSDGPAYLDQFLDALPHKEIALRQVLQQIDAAELITFVERAVAIYLHRRQMVLDLAALGTSRVDALQHRDMPRYAPLMAAMPGVGRQFQQKVDAYIAKNYPWAGTS